MSHKTKFWFHCGRCNSLFHSKADELELSIFCTACGYCPYFFINPPTRYSPISKLINKETISTNEIKYGNRKKNWVLKDNHSGSLIKIFTVWFIILLILIFIIRWICNDGTNNPELARIESSAKNANSEENMDFINRVGPLCNQALSDFISSATSETRSQLVYTSATTAARMAEFYRMNSLESIDRHKLSLDKISVLDLPIGRAIESYWKLSDGRLLDVVFLEEGGEWRIDWDHYAKFSDYPWALFLSGKGEARGEFRLLARERLADHRKNTSSLSLSLYQPRFGHPNEMGFQSPEFLVERTNKNGKQLADAFALAKSGKRVFNAQLPSIYPEGLIPIRAKIRRFELNFERHFEIEEIVACHWYSIGETIEKIPYPHKHKDILPITSHESLKNHD